MSDSNQNLKLKGPALQMFLSGTELYDISGSAMQSHTTESENRLRYRGGNTLRFLMLFNYPGDLSTAPYWEMVKRIMENPKALNRKEEEFTVVNLAENPGYGFDEIIAELNPEFCLIWGAEACSGIEYRPYQIIERNGLKILITDDPLAVQASRELKDKLWSHLQHQL